MIQRLWFCLICFCSMATNIAAQGSGPAEERWLIEWNMDEHVYKKMKNRSRTDTYFEPGEITFNAQSLKVGEIHTRGKTSLTFWRKSYNVSVKLDSDCEAFGMPAMDKFYLISMTMDKYFIRNRFAFDCLAELDLFPLYYHYTELKINGSSEGLYLLVQRPADYVLDDLKSMCILRRGSTNYMVKEKFAKKAEKDVKVGCKAAFHAIASACNHLKGEELYQRLQERVDLNGYFMWLTFNYLVRNGDYTDELFYYTMPGEQEYRLGIVPWDFDDILAQQPHEGSAIRDERLDDQLIFSSEDLLDRTIASDPYLYQKYLDQAERVLAILTPDRMKEIFDTIGEDLESYLGDPAILDASQQDENPPKGIKNLKENILATYGYLKTRRKVMLRKIKVQSRT